MKSLKDEDWGESLKALIIIDMTNDFVFEKYEYEGRAYEGNLVAPLGKKIVGPIAELVEKIIRRGNAAVLRLTKDHYNAFTNPRLELELAELGIDEVFMTGLVDEVCIYHNALVFLERGFRTNVVKGCTAPFEEEKGKKALEEIKASGVKLVDDIPEDVELILLIEDEHDENSEELISGSWPPHNMKGTPGALTVKPIREALGSRNQE